MDYTQEPPPPEYVNMPPPPRGFRGAGSGAGQTFLQSCLVAGCATIIAPFALVFGFMLLFYLFASRAIPEAGNIDSIYSSGTSSNLRERVIRPGALGSGAIAIINIHGAIDGDGSPLEGTGTLAAVTEELRTAAEDDDITAVLLQIDSPGGGLTASDQIHQEVKRFRETGKRVFVWAGDTMASGGYYIAVAAEGIMVSPTSTIGSIGVIVQHIQAEDLLRRLGVEVSPITSGERKDMGSPFREMRPEEREIIQSYVNAAHQRFVDIVAEGRDLPREEVMASADGSIFTPAEALERRLVDSIGYIEDAVDWIENEVGETDMRVISYRRLFTLSDILRETGRGVASSVMEAAGQPSRKRIMAQWADTPSQ